MTLHARFAAVDAVLQNAVAEARVPGAVALVTDRRGVLFEAAHGAATTLPPSPMCADTVFRIASMTKPLTSIAVMMLLEEGKLALDDPLAAHLPGFEQPPVLRAFDEQTGEYAVRPASRPVTLRDLLSHTSGFGYWFLDRELLIEANGRIDYFGAPFLMHDPGERFSYGIGTDVLGLLFEPVAGLAIERFFAERITGPLDMKDTRFEPPADPRRLAGLYKRSGGTFEHGPNESRGEGPRGGGGLYSTARDYCALLRMLLNDGRIGAGARLLSAESVRQMTSNQIGELFAALQRTAFPARTLDFTFLDGTQKFGLNLMIEAHHRPGRRFAGSWGWAGIFNTYFWGDPKTGIGAVVMMQMSPFCDSECLAVVKDVETAVYASI